VSIMSIIVRKSFIPYSTESLYLDFEDPTAVITDKSAGGNNSWTNVAGSSVLDTNLFKSGLRSLNGGSRRIKHSLTTALSLGTNPFTIQFWLYPKSSQPAQANGYVPILGGSVYSSGVLFYRPSGTSPANCVQWYQPNYITQTNLGLTLDTWTHIRLVKHTNGYCYIFMNGINRTASASLSPINLTTAWTTNGFHVFAEPGASRYCIGNIDCLQIIKQSLGVSNFTPTDRAGII